MRPLLMTDSNTASGTAANTPAGGAGQLLGGSGVAGGTADAGDASRAAEPLDFVKVLDAYESKLMRYASTLLGGAGAKGQSSDAGQSVQPGDLVQEAFLRLHRTCREHGGSSIEHPGAWLYRVVHNLAMDAIRQRVRQRDAQQQIEDAARLRAATADASDEAAMGELEQREIIALAMRLLGDLPEQQQQVITLKLLEGLTLRQIAVVLDSSPGSVNYHLNQGLARLAQQLRQKGVL